MPMRKLTERSCIQVKQWNSMMNEGSGPGVNVLQIRFVPRKWYWNDTLETQCSTVWRKLWLQLTQIRFVYVNGFRYVRCNLMSEWLMLYSYHSLNASYLRFFFIVYCKEHLRFWFGCAVLLVLANRYLTDGPVRLEALFLFSLFVRAQVQLVCNLLLL